LRNQELDFSLPMPMVCTVRSVVGIVTMTVGVMTMIRRTVPPAPVTITVPKIYRGGGGVYDWRSADRRGSVNRRRSLIHRRRGAINWSAVNRGRSLIGDLRSHNRRNR